MMKVGRPLAKLHTRNSGLAITMPNQILYVVSDTDVNVIYDPDHNSFVSLNQTALEMWRKLIETKSATEVVRIIARKYDVSQNTVRDDLSDFLAELAARRIVPDDVALVDAPQRETKKPGTSLPTILYNHSSTAKPKLRSILSAYIGLLCFDLFMHLRTFKALCTHIKTWPIAATKPQALSEVTREFCSAVNRACIWYPKKVVCLQRSALITCILRNHGIDAHLIIGVRAVPFEAHAWVEVDDAVINDSPNVQKFYRTVASY